MDALTSNDQRPDPPFGAGVVDFDDVAMTALMAAMRRYELAVQGAGGVDGPAPPGLAGLELARARMALVLELKRRGWEPDSRVLSQLQRDRARVGDRGLHGEDGAVGVA